MYPCDLTSKLPFVAIVNAECARNMTARRDVWVCTSSVATRSIECWQIAKSLLAAEQRAGIVCLSVHTMEL
ncbi:uncharacterized protein MYCGRDRAFT_104142 [Zymoseptoria tritici IPO323]|uniref:Uncharacterized protein n=1 Tax=Zymoseptoria tritici (strain CBS 115943 / IPO323) TaxID=336722 RepID=F9X9K5_ZYMTI|nr:uncharacterized protein MYCGRDRAFT_104142 [Zymoseptoria tritici IPO323]EGP87944.1 hypothetical protein MYCGRDRAFT_104142 [Zymoseptoria tritici IPO323]